MRIVPQSNMVLGRIVDLTKTKGGLHMANTQAKGVTIFVLVDDIGPDVRNYKKGDVVVPHHVEHIWLRGGQHHRVVFEDTAVRALVEDVDLSQFTVEGEEASHSAAGALV